MDSRILGLGRRTERLPLGKRRLAQSSSGRQWIPGYWTGVSGGYQWTSGYWADADAGQIDYLPQPPATVEAGPTMAAPSEGSIWVPGVWEWHDGRYNWRPGYWVEGRENWVWIPSHYVSTPRGYVYSNGYWDYDVDLRGVAYAPVYLGSEIYNRPNFGYSPSVAINMSLFADDLFVRPDAQHYYYGDYYDTRYADTGYYPAYTYSSEHRGYDPFYAQRRWANRGDLNWDRAHEDRFNYRRDNIDARPPLSLGIQNERIANNITNNANIGSVTNNVNDARNYRAVGSVNDVVARGGQPIPLRKVAPRERQIYTQRIMSLQKSQVERQRVETTPRAQVDPKLKRSDRADRVKMPRSAITAAPNRERGAGMMPPQRPTAPKIDQTIRPQPLQRPAIPANNLRQNLPATPPATVLRETPRPGSDLSRRIELEPGSPAPAATPGTLSDRVGSNAKMNEQRILEGNAPRTAPKRDVRPEQEEFERRRSERPKIDPETKEPIPSEPAPPPTAVDLPPNSGSPGDAQESVPGNARDTRPVPKANPPVTTQEAKPRSARDISKEPQRRVRVIQGEKIRSSNSSPSTPQARTTKVNSPTKGGQKVPVQQGKSVK